MPRRRKATAEPSPLQSSSKKSKMDTAMASPHSRTLTELPNKDTSSRTLMELPNELVMEIACWLDPRSMVMLGLAWRPFLHQFAQTFDPWNEKRRALRAFFGDGVEQNEVKDMSGDGENSAVKTSTTTSITKDLSHTREAFHALIKWRVGLAPDLDCDILSSRETDFFRAFSEFRQLDDYRWRRRIVLGPVRSLCVRQLYDLTRRDLTMLDPLQGTPHALGFRLEVEMDFLMTTQVRRELALTIANPHFPLFTLMLLSTEIVIEQGDIDAIIEAFSKNRRLRELYMDFPQETVTDEGLSGILSSVSSHPAIEKLAVPMTSGNAPALVDLLRSTKCLRFLDMTHSYLDDHEALCNVMEAINNCSTLTALHVMCCNMRKEEATILADMLQTNATLKELRVYNNPEMGDSGVMAIVRALKQSAGRSAVEKLDLDLTGMGVKGLRAITSMLKVNENISMSLAVEVAYKCMRFHPAPTRFLSEELWIRDNPVGQSEHGQQLIEKLEKEMDGRVKFHAVQPVEEQDPLLDDDHHHHHNHHHPRQHHDILGMFPLGHRHREGNQGDNDSDHDDEVADAAANDAQRQHPFLDLMTEQLQNMFNNNPQLFARTIANIRGRNDGNPVPIDLHNDNAFLAAAPRGGNRRGAEVRAHVHDHDARVNRRPQRQDIDEDEEETSDSEWEDADDAS